MKRSFFLVLWLFVLPIATYAQEIVIETQSIPLSIDTPECTGKFVTHTLDHITTVPGGNEVRQFEANGSGVAINDLDNDGDLDIVLANHAGRNSILWNEGRLNFRTEQMAHGDSRSVSIVDVDGDGWRDIFFTRTVSAPGYWHNLGDGRFMQEILPDFAEPLYSIAWADLDQDGDLDLVGGSYDAALLDAFGQEFLLNSRGGVYYYENDEGVFRPTRLAYEAQALALVLVDINDDQRLDIVVGNDFAVPDYIWVQTSDGWEESSKVFRTTTHSTMSYDFADLNNDGSNEIFATDMKPYQSDDKTLSAWQPIIESMNGNHRNSGDPQVMENVLLSQSSASIFFNDSNDMGVDATGWSWSGKFGDLDQDGFLDLYVVNGFLEYTMFGHLDNHELVEENQVFRNRDGVRFEKMPEWGLASTSSGRGMSMGDLDMDGDLDIVVNNLRDPAQLFENQLCSGRSLQVDLIWDGSININAIGAELILHTDAGSLYRDIKSSSGYLSGDPTRLHFGLSSDERVSTLEIRWSDGLTSHLSVPPNSAILRILRDDSAK